MMLNHGCVDVTCYHTDSLVFWASTIAYGWAVRARAPLAVALVFQFISQYLHYGPLINPTAMQTC